MTEAENAQQSGFRPALVTQIELSQALPDIQTRDGSAAYTHAQALVRIHGEPLGIIDLELDGGKVGAETYAPLVWEKFAEGANRHLEADGLPCAEALPAAGLSAPQAGAACEKARAAALAKAPPATVIIATRERAEQLERCLRSFKDIVYPSYELLVVDNNPATDATVELIKRMSAELPNLRYVRDDRRGVSWARDRGIDEAKGEIIAFTDDDVVVDQNWLIELARAFQVAGNVGCVTGPLVPMEMETEAQELFERYGGFNQGFNQRIFDLGEHRMTHIMYPYYVGECGTGASMAFTRKALLEIGGQDPALGAGTLTLGGGDIESFFQVIMHGYQLVYTPTSLAWHQHRRSYDGLRRQIYCYGVGLTAYLTKCLVSDPRRIPGFLWRIPRGAVALIAFKLKKTPTVRGLDYPRELVSLERKGMLYGPLAYFRSIAYVRKAQRAEKAAS